MPIKVKFFGDLKKKIENHNTPTGFPYITLIDEKEVQTTSDILHKFSINESEVYHIFVNNKYAGLTKKVKNGDVVSFFPIRMSLLYKWYFKREEDA